MKSVDREDEALSTADVAEALGVSRRAVYDLVASRAIEHERPTPGLIRVRRSALERYIESVRVPATGGGR
jgi:excisionase family DNA binding protein